MSTISSPPVRSHAFDSWVERCRISDADRRPGAGVEGEQLLDLISSLPGDLTDRQQALAGNLLARQFCRFVSTLGRHIVSDLARRALADDEMSEWFTVTHRLAGLIVRAAGLSGRSAALPPPHTDARVERALGEIERHFTNPRFGLRAAAQRVALSDCRLTQLFKATTGRTFGSHLHHRRIAAARRLLNESALSIKEIASRVGYQSTTQLDRHFKRIAQRPPSAYRASTRQSPGTGAPVIAGSARPAAAPKLTHTKQQN
jgi:AraC-like DNA-binding protein